MRLLSPSYLIKSFKEKSLPYYYHKVISTRAGILLFYLLKYIFLLYLLNKFCKYSFSLEHYKKMKKMFNLPYYFHPPEKGYKTSC